MMDTEAIYERHYDCTDSSEDQTWIHMKKPGKAQMLRGRRCLVLMAMSLGLICVLLLIFIIRLNITITAEREEHKNTVQEFNHTINSLQTNYTDLRTEKDQLQKKNQQSETRVKDLTAEKQQLQQRFDSLNQKNQQSETRVKDLTAEKQQLQQRFDSLNQKNQESETRVKDLTNEKQQLQQRFDSLNQKNQESETRVKNLTNEKQQLQQRFDSLNQKNQELERNVTSLGEELQKKLAKEGCFFLSIEASWSESRQFCRDRGADLVIIKTEEKQRFLSSLVKERAWIGLSDTETEGVMKWVDNSPLIQGQGFWVPGQPSNYGGNEDCIEINFNTETLHSWNDHTCSDKRKGICEK